MLTVFGFITWIVFAILQWGTCTINWFTTAPFWFWFPLWIGFAGDVVLEIFKLIYFKILDL